MHRLRMLLPLWLALAGTWVRPCIVRGQSSALIEGAPVPLHTSMEPAVCGESMPAASVKEALSRVCLRERSSSGSITARNPIIIGFVGGFVRREDIRHPEVENLPDDGKHAEDFHVFAWHPGSRTDVGTIRPRRLRGACPFF